MDLALLRRLTTGEGWGLMQSLPPYDESGALALQQRLRDAGFEPDLVAAALNQARLRARATDKFGEFARGMVLTSDGLEQATRLGVAAQHAQRFRAAGIHTVHDLGCKITVSIDLEVDGNMPLIEAHDIAHELERHIRDDFGTDVEVDTHIEPLEPEMPHGADASPARVEEISGALIKLASDGVIHHIHNVRVRDTEAGEIVNFHCYAEPSLSVIAVHEHVDEIERRLRRAFPTVKRVISHAEPPNAD